MPFITNDTSKALIAEREGVWVNYQEGELLIARMGNPRNRKVFAHLRKPYERQLSRKSLPDDVTASIVAETYAESILLDWRGITDADGNDYPYTKENAIAALKHDMDLREFVESASQDAAAYRDEEIANTAKK